MHTAAFLDNLEKAFTSRRCQFPRQRMRVMRDPSQVEFVAQAHEAVLVEELSPGRLRILSLRDGKARTRDPRWYDGIKTWCCTRLDRWLDQREVRRDLRRRRSRDAKLREEMEHRRYGPAFVCRLPSKLLR